MESLLTQVIKVWIENIPLTPANIDIAPEVPLTKTGEIIMVMTTTNVKIGTIADSIPSEQLQKKIGMKTKTEPKHPLKRHTMPMNKIKAVPITLMTTLLGMTITLALLNLNQVVNHMVSNSPAGTPCMKIYKIAW